MTGHWHIASGQLADYLADRVDQPTASSIEAHLINCGECRQALATRFDVVDRGRFVVLDRASDRRRVRLPRPAGSRTGPV